MKNESRGKYLIKNTAIFAFGSISTKFIHFFLVPFYTYALTTEQYGTIDVINSISSMLIPLIMCNIGEAIRRYLLDKNSDRDKIRFIEFFWIITGFIISIIVYGILRFIPSFREYALLMSTFTFTSALFQTVQDYLRGQEKLVSYTLCSILSTIGVAVLNIIFLKKLNLGINGYFLSYIAIYVLVSLIAFIFGKQYKEIRHIKYDKALFKDMSLFSITLVPNSIMWWITNSSDRLMVTSFISPAANGIYSISYKLPTLMSTLNTVLMQAWQYSAIKESDSSDRIEYNNYMFKMYTAAISIVAAGLLLINRPFINIYVAPEFREAWKYSPFLIVGSMFQTLSTFVGTSYYVEKDMKGNLISATVGAVVNVCLNLVLIPLLGITGAAVATCTSYITVLFYRIKDTKKYIPLSIDKKFTCKLTITICFMLIFSFMDNLIGNVILFLGTILVLIFTRDFYIGIIWKVKNRIKRCK